MDTTADRSGDRHAALRDRANYIRPSLVDQLSATRRALLGQLGELAAVLGAGDPAAEGITSGELAAIRRAALRLAAAADAALDAAGDPR